MMEIEFHQLDLRYEGLRIRSRDLEKRLVASIAEVGQLVPIVIVPADENPGKRVLIDGFKRVRAMRRLRCDIVRATLWDLKEIDALLLVRSMRARDGEAALEQGWLLHALHDRFDLDFADLSRLFDRSQSWVSRRIDLVRQLPDTVQESIRAGRIVAHAAGKYLVPLARANREHCERLSQRIASSRLSSRQVKEIYDAWRDSGPEARERIVEDPLTFLRAREEMGERDRDRLGPREGLLQDVAMIAAASRRATQRLRGGVAGMLTERDQDDIYSSVRLAGSEIRRLQTVLEETMGGTG